MNLNPVRSQPMLGSAVSQRSGLQFKNQTMLEMNDRIVAAILHASKKSPNIGLTNQRTITKLQERINTFYEQLSKLPDSIVLQEKKPKPSKKKPLFPRFELKSSQPSSSKPPQLLVGPQEVINYFNRLNKPSKRLRIVQSENGWQKEKTEEPSLFHVPLDKLPTLSSKKQPQKKLTPPDLLEAFSNLPTQSKKSNKQLVLKPKSTPLPNSEEPSPEEMERLEELSGRNKGILVTHGVDQQTFEDTLTLTYNNKEGSKESDTILGNGSLSDSPPYRAKRSNGKGDGVSVPAMTKEQEATRQAALDKARNKPITTLADHMKAWERDNARYKPYSKTPILKKKAEGLGTHTLVQEAHENLPIKPIIVRTTTNKNGQNVRHLELQKPDGTVETREIPNDTGERIKTSSPQIQALFASVE
ncbi:MAG: hypothetical protein ACK5T0_04260 [Vampirovibrionales bacterium]